VARRVPADGGVGVWTMKHRGVWSAVARPVPGQAKGTCAEGERRIDADSEVYVAAARTLAEQLGAIRLPPLAADTAGSTPTPAGHLFCLCLPYEQRARGASTVQARERYIDGDKRSGPGRAMATSWPIGQ
jgi:hypothetical protein